MQRDFDLVVTLLGTLRDADTASLAQQNIEASIQAIMPDAPLALVAHHLDILLDAGLIAAVPHPEGTHNAPLWRITWKGHDALEQEEDADEDESND